jgi:hypothetical protein
MVAGQIEAHKFNPRLHRVFLEQLPKVGLPRVRRRREPLGGALDRALPA